MSGVVKLGISSNSDHFITSILPFSKTITFLLFLLLLRLSRLRSIDFNYSNRSSSKFRFCSTDRGLRSLLNHGFGFEGQQV